jgi:hypothetical protein
MSLADTVMNLRVSEKDDTKELINYQLLKNNCNENHKLSTFAVFVT